MTDMLEFFQIIAAHKQSAANMVHGTELSKKLSGKSSIRSGEVMKAAREVKQTKLRGGKQFMKQDIPRINLEIPLQYPEK